MNLAVLIGRLTKDPETRYTQSGAAMASFTLAVDRGYGKQEREEKQAQSYQTADFIRCKAWGKTAETVNQYLGKGQRVAVEGKIETGSYENNQGQKVYTTDVVADRVEFIEWANRDNSQGNFGNAKQTVRTDDYDDFEEYDSKMPF